MKVLSHRGCWNKPEEKNTKIAFNYSFESGFGVETDVRDVAGRLVISHDMPSGAEMDLGEFMALLNGRPLPIALNIKSDGLVSQLVAILGDCEVHDWFVFDMSVPDMKSYISAGVPVFTRMSEVEREPIWLAGSVGVWLDSFDGIWYDNELIENLLKLEKRVCVVSPELHKRDYLPLWHQLRPLAGSDLLMLCTDLPNDAADFFGLKYEN
jgi:glycerophosphoryl diester phosphodiesterase